MEDSGLVSRVPAACLAIAGVLLLASCGGDGGGQAGLPVRGEQWTRTYEGTGPATSVQPTAGGGYVVAGSTNSFGAGDLDAWVLKLDGSGNAVWQKTYGAAGPDVVHHVQPTPDGGYIVAGETASFPTGTGLDCWFDAWVLKLDASGNVVWQKTYGGAGCDSADSVQATPDGGYIVAGSTRSFGAGNSDAWISKLDSGGNVVWQRTYGGGDYDRAYSVRLTSDGGYIVAGDTESPYESGFDAWILKLDSSGNVVWQKKYGGGGSDAAYSVEPTVDGGYVVAGHLEPFGAGNSVGPRRAWVAKLDAGGNVLWQKHYGGAGGDAAYSVQPTADGGYIVGATTASFGIGHPSAWLLKLDASGNVTWQRAYGGVASGLYAVLTTADGGYVMAGYWGVGTFPPHPGFNFYAQAWIARLGATGEISGCALGGTIDASTADGNAIAGTARVTVAASSAMAIATTIVPGNSAAAPRQQCP